MGFYRSWWSCRICSRVQGRGCSCSYWKLGHWLAQAHKPHWYSGEWNLQSRDERRATASFGMDMFMSLAIHVLISLSLVCARIGWNICEIYILVLWVLIFQDFANTHTTLQGSRVVRPRGFASKFESGSGGESDFKLAGADVEFEVGGELERGWGWIGKRFGGYWNLYNPIPRQTNQPANEIQLHSTSIIDSCAISPWFSEIGWQFRDTWRWKEGESRVQWYISFLYFIIKSPKRRIPKPRSAILHWGSI